LQNEIILPVETSSLTPVSPCFSNKAAIDCDLIAPWYEPVEHLCFGGALEQRRNCFLPDLGGARRALSCGEGDGRFTAALLQSNPQVEVTAIDASRKMAGLGGRRVARMGSDLRRRLQYQCGEIHNFQPPQRQYDLIATHFFLDCFITQEAAAAVHRIAKWAAPRSRWIVSEFAQPSAPIGHFWTGAVIRSLYAAFRVTTGLRVTHLPDYRPALRSVGFELRREERALGGLLVSELWESG
jgi:ubiquinone/menaquinone biosynthesis C-methylase UbiE